MRISHIIHGRRPVTAELAFLIGKATGQPPEYWLNLQMDYDLKVAGRTVKRKLQGIRTMVVFWRPFVRKAKKGLSPFGVNP